MTTEAETKVMQLLNKENQVLTGWHQSLEEVKQTLPRALRELGHADTLILHF